MTGFRILLALMGLTLLAYTGVVVAEHGLNLLAVFFGDMAKMDWPGQFNLDFMFMLTLSALWVGWRHRFTPSGLGLALLALFGGALFLTAYLSVLAARAKGDPRQILLGGRA